MAVPPAPYPRSNLRKIVKAHSDRKLTKNVDVMIFLNYQLFLREIVREAAVREKQTGGRGGISAASVQDVTETSLRKFKG